MRIEVNISAMTWNAREKLDITNHLDIFKKKRERLEYIRTTVQSEGKFKIIVLYNDTSGWRAKKNRAKVQGTKASGGAKKSASKVK